MYNRRIAIARVLIYIFVFLVILLLSCLTPMLADDFSYSFSYATGERIKTIGDVFSSLKAHRITMNGRMISHGLTMIFLLLPKSVFNIANAANATFLLWLCSRFFSSGHPTWRELTITATTALLLWVFMPVFGQVFLWLDGSLNYSWAMSIILLFLLPFYKEYRNESVFFRRNSILTLLFYLLSFAAGAYSENASCAGIMMALFFLILIYRKQKGIPFFLVLSVIIAAFGFLFMMLAPAESSRAAQTDLIGIAKNIQRVVEAPQKVLLPLYCSFTALLVISLLTKRDIEAIATSLVFFFGSIISVAVFIFAVYFPWRSLCATTIFLVLSNLVLLNEFWNGNNLIFIPTFTASLAVYCVFSFILAVGDVGVLYLESKQRETEINTGIEEGFDPVTVHQYSSNTKYAASYLLPDLYEDSTEWPNYDVAAYYGAPAIKGLPPVEVFGEG